MSYVGKRRFPRYVYQGIPSENGEDDDVREIEYVVIKVIEGARTSYYCRQGDKLIPDLDNGFDKASKFSKSEAEKIKSRLNKQHPTAKIELRPYHKQ